RLDLSALVEEHKDGRVLLRAATRLRLTGLGAFALAVIAALSVSASIVEARVLPLAGLGLVLMAVKAALSLRLLQATAAVQRATSRTAAVLGMISLDEPRATRVPRPRLVWGLRGVAATMLLGLVSLSGSSTVPVATAAPENKQPKKPEPALP